MVTKVLEELKSAPIQSLPLAEIQHLPALQPRDAVLVPYKDKGRVARRSSDHVESLRLALDSAQHVQLEPVLIAGISSPPRETLLPLMPATGGLFLVDGHHRLKAYKDAKRTTIPARVRAMDVRTAVLISKLANCTDRALEMHIEQRREAAWQYLAAVTLRGETPLPSGESQRSVAGRMGVSKNTVGRMLHRIPQIRLDEYQAEELDPGTKWPRWRNVRISASGWQTQLNITAEQQSADSVQKVIDVIVYLMENTTRAERVQALERLTSDEAYLAEQQDTTEFLTAIAELDPM